MSLTAIPSQDFLKKAAAVAAHYGFVPLSEALRGEAHESGRPLREARVIQLPALAEHDPVSGFATDVLNTCLSCNAQLTHRKEPLFIYHMARESRPAAGGVRGKTDKRIRFGIAVIGSSQSIGEALIIKTALAILEEAGVRERELYLNSIGDKDSGVRFSREVTTFLRRHYHELPGSCQQAMKRDLHETLGLLLEKAPPLYEQMPRPMHYLSEVSRRHLRDLLEFLELDQIPYTLEDTLLGHRDCYNQTLFEIRAAAAEGPARVLARGGRCDEIARKHFRSSVPVVSAIFEHEPRAIRRALTLQLRPRQPKFFLIQLGPNAKLLSLSVLESLRKAHIPVRQAIGNDSLRDQLEHARAVGVPYLIIMGQREVLDRTAIVRNIHSQAQETVPIASLSTYLKGRLRI